MIFSEQFSRSVNSSVAIEAFLEIASSLRRLIWETPYMAHEALAILNRLSRQITNTHAQTYGPSLHEELSITAIRAVEAQPASCTRACHLFLISLPIFYFLHGSEVAFALG